MYEIVEYEKHFDVAQNRKAARHTWFACPNPNKESGRKFTRMMHHELSLAHYGSWTLLVGLASTMPERGKFFDGDEYTLDDILLMLPSTDKAGLRAAIEYFLEIGWLIQHDTTALPLRYHCTTTALPVDYQCTGSTVGTTLHNSTLHNKTEQDKTKQEISSLDSEKKEYVSSPEKYAATSEIELAWAKIPKHKQIDKGGFRTAWVREITRTDIDPESVCEKLEKYYKSDKGRGKYSKNPTTLINGEFWLEDESAWQDKKEKPAKFTESPFDHEKIIKAYATTPEKKKIIQQLRSEGKDNGMIAYKIDKGKI